MRFSAQRPLVLAARGTVLLVMAVGSVGYSLADKTVTISVDGSTRTVHTFAGDVSSALRRAGVTVGVHDVVVPSVRQALHDGSHITVDRGRQLSISVNGARRTVWVTQEDPADELGLDLSGAYVASSSSSLVVRLPQQVSLTVGGAARTVTTTAATVADLLAAQGIHLGPFDVVSLPLGDLPVSGTPLRVTQVTHTQWLERAPLAMPTLQVADARLTVGRDKLAHDGRAGTRYTLWGVVTSDGTVVETKLLKTSVAAAKPKVIRYGTKRTVVRNAPVEAAAVTESTIARPKTKPGVQKPVVHRQVDHQAAPKRHVLDWAALARCESGGNPRLVDGAYYGLYQFSMGTWHSVGGKGRPSDASSAEQTRRAQRLYAEQGRSPWPACGHYL